MMRQQKSERQAWIEGPRYISKDTHTMDVTGSVHQNKKIKNNINILHLKFLGVLMHHKRNLKRGRKKDVIEFHHVGSSISGA